MTRLSRRGLLGAGLGAAAASALGGRAPAAQAAPRTGRLEANERPNVVLVVMERMRADATGAYDGDGADTPALDALADRSLRIEHAIPEGLPGVPVRRALLTGMRSYPFRDWQAVRGIPAVPGWNPIWPYQPLLPQVLADAGVLPWIVSDDPLLGGSEPMDTYLRRTRSMPSLEGCDPDDAPCQACLPCLSADAAEVPGYLVPLAPGLRARTDPTARVMKAGIRALDDVVDRQPFFLALDVFDPADVARVPRSFVDGDRLEAREGFTPRDSPVRERVPVTVSDETAARVRDLYRAQQTANDRWLGRLLDHVDELGIRERTMVIVVSDGAIALGEHGVWGHPEGVGSWDPYAVPFLIFDPRGRRRGDTTGFRASTHDVAPTILGAVGAVAPGRMNGEDLTALLDEEDLMPRSVSTTIVGATVMAGDEDHVLVADIEGQSRQLFDDDEEDKGDNVTSSEPEKLDALWAAAVRAGGGTLPELGEETALRPLIPDDDDEEDEDDEGDDADAD